jgi:cell division transport system permease protein
LAAPVLAAFAGMAAPLLGGAAAGQGWASLRWGALPWAELALLPPAAALIGWVTAQATLRAWLRRLP